MGKRDKIAGYEFLCSFKNSIEVKLHFHHGEAVLFRLITFFITFMENNISAFIKEKTIVWPMFSLLMQLDNSYSYINHYHDMIENCDINRN